MTGGARNDEASDIVIPLLASLDLDETCAFYGKLGFRTARVAPDYVIARRDALEIHFWDCDERHIAENTSCYLRMADAAALYAEYAALDLAPGRMDEIADMPWGMREFHVWDPHGNLLKIGQDIEQDSQASESGS